MCIRDRVALRKQGRQEGKAAMRILPPGTIAFFQRYSRAFSLFGLGFLVTFPAIAIGLAGWGGALKWIDNFGVQILIYVMLGWGPVSYTHLDVYKRQSPMRPPGPSVVTTCTALATCAMASRKTWASGWSGGGKG